MNKKEIESTMCQVIPFVIILIIGSFAILRIDYITLYSDKGKMCISGYYFDDSYEAGQVIYNKTSEEYYCYYHKQNKRMHISTLSVANPLSYRIFGSYEVVE